MFTGILLYQRFSEYELSLLLSVLHQGGKKVKYIGLDDQVVKGEAGLPCVPETTIQEVDLEMLDSIVLPGVDDFEHLVDHPELAAFLVRACDNKRIIAAISSAPYLLSMSGLLSEKKYTTGLTEEQRDFLGGFNEDNYLDAHVVVDDTIITAKGSAFKEFAFAFGNRLELNFHQEWYGLG